MSSAARSAVAWAPRTLACAESHSRRRSSSVETDWLPLVARLCGAVELGFGVGLRGFRDLQRGVRLVQCGDERPLVDDEKQVALFDQCAVGEVNLLQIAADTRAHRDLVDSLEAADELVVVDDVANDRLGNGDGRRRRGAACWACAR
jgi:hypothetical protein